MAVSKKFVFFFLLPVLVALGAYALHFHTTPVFQAAVLQRIANEAKARYPPDDSLATLEATVQFISAELKKAYPRHIHPNNEWVTNLAGGFKTAMLILHASCTEYVMIWGSQVDTTGHSGRNAAQFSDWIISGEGKWWKEGGLAVQTASPQSNNYVHTPYYSGGMVQLNNGTFMLEHATGVIPLLLPFGLGDSIFSSMDPVTIYKSLTAYGRLTIHELFVNGKL